MSTSTKTPSTLFPKIPEIGGFLVAYRTLRNNVQGTPSIVNLKGTVKLHGTHADMVIHSDGTVFIQSRNRIITPGVNLDNHDCAKTLLPLLPEILALRDQFEARYKELNKGQAASRKDPMISKCKSSFLSC